MKIYLSVPIMLIGLILIVTPFILSLTYFERVVVGERLCVDGMRNINLEGIMCQETEEQIFGYNMNSKEGIFFSFVLVFSFIFGMIFFVIGIIGAQNG